MFCVQRVDSILRTLGPLVLLGLLGPSLIAEELPDMDFAITVKMTPSTLPKEHADLITRCLQSDARQVFSRMSSPAASPADAPKDGAAKYRLYIDYATAISLGNQLQLKAERIKNNAGNITIRRWYIAFDQKPTCTIRLAKWSGDQYVDHLKVSQVIQKTPEDLRLGPQLMVFENTNPTGSATDTDTCPITMDEARLKALQGARQPSIRTTLCSTLVPITLARGVPTRMDAGKPAELAADLKVENKSPWPLKSFEYTFLQGGVAFKVVDEKFSQTIALPEPLAPGRSTTVKAKAVLGGLSQGTQRVDFLTDAQP